MAQRARNHNNTYDSRYQNRKDTAYIRGSAAFQPNTRRLRAEPERIMGSHEARKNRDKARYMNLGYVLFLAAALCVAGVVLIGYIWMGWEQTNQARRISSLEIQVNHLRQQNEEAYISIESSIDLEEIKRIAIGELGMIYPREGQIIAYDTGESDFFRVVDDKVR